MSESDPLFVTDSEMSSFIHHLFDDKDSVVNSTWDLTLPDESILKDDSVTYATESEVKGFITELFKN